MEEKLQELLPGLTEENNSVPGAVTARALIRNASDDDGYLPAVAMMYSNIEENLIYRFGLEHKDKRFVMDYNEYMQLTETLKAGDRYLLKRYDREREEYTVIPPNVTEFALNGLPQKAEMPPIVRFIKAGLNPFEAKKATEYWSILNKLRHRSPDNEAYLSKIFEELYIPKKEYLIQILDFFKLHGLYTKD